MGNILYHFALNFASEDSMNMSWKFNTGFSHGGLVLVDNEIIFEDYNSWMGTTVLESFLTGGDHRIDIFGGLDKDDYEFRMEYREGYGLWKVVSKLNLDVKDTFGVAIEDGVVSEVSKLGKLPSSEFVNYSFSMNENFTTSIDIDGVKLGEVIGYDAMQSTIKIGSSSVPWVVESVTIEEQAPKSVLKAPSSVGKRCVNSHKNHLCCSFDDTDIVGKVHVANLGVDQSKTEALELAVVDRVFGGGNVPVAFQNSILLRNSKRIAHVKFPKLKSSKIAYAGLRFTKIHGDNGATLKVLRSSCKWSSSSVTYNSRARNDVILSSMLVPFGVNIPMYVSLHVEDLVSVSDTATCISLELHSKDSSELSLDTRSLELEILYSIQDLIVPRYINENMKPAGYGSARIVEEIRKQQSGVFRINPSSGQLHLLEDVLDFETRRTYSLRIVVSDNGSPSLRSSA